MNFLLPPQCLNCSALVDQPGTLCAACWMKVSFLDGPACACCGLPFELPVMESALCAACIRRPPSYDRARAALLYDDIARGLLLRFKHADRTDFAPAFARWLARSGAGLTDSADLIVPVPLHYWRQVMRRYNQAGLLAQRLSRLSGRPAALDLLRRVRHTPAQARLSGRERRRNVAQAFRVKAQYIGVLTGKRILLVDDVLTTGATVDSCARTLKAAGAKTVDVLALARVVHPSVPVI